MIESGRPATSPPDADAAARIAMLEREARALGAGVDAARLWHEIGHSWEELQSPRNAAIAYQNAYRLAPGLVPNLRSARRLFADVGNWQMVAQLADAEAQVAGSDAERARLLVEKGVVLQERLGRLDEAVACFEKALTLAPGELLPLHQLEGAHADGKDPRALAAVHERLAKAMHDPALCAFHLSTAASLRERAGQREEALRLYREAFAHDRHDPVVLSELERLAEAAGRWEELISVLGAAAEAGGPGAAAQLCRVARIERERLGREDMALKALLDARRLAPGDATVLDELAALHEARGAMAELADVLEARAASTKDALERAAVLVRLGGLYDEKLDDRPRAAHRYLAALTLAPGNTHVLSALGRLQHQLADYEGLLATFEDEAATAGELRLRAARLFKAAELLEEKLAREPEAIARYEEILSFAPGYLPAQKALTRLYEKLGKHGELTAMLERELDGAADRDQALDLLGRIADIQGSKLGDARAAMATFERMLQLAPDHLPTIRALARAAERCGDPEALVRANDREAALTTDQRQVVALLHRNCEILEELVGDRDRAIEAYRKVLALAPSYLPALRSLGRLYAQKGRWEELADMYRQEAEVAPTADAAAGLYVKIGELHESRIADEERAVAAYREALRLSPGHLGALSRLERIHAARGAWDAMVQVLREDAAARLDAGERARVLLSIAQIQEERLGRSDEAADAYQEALRHDPSNLAALRALDRLYARSGAFRELAQVWERELLVTPAAGRVPVLLRLAFLHLEKLEGRARAAQLAESVLAIEPGNVRALKTLERIRTADGDRTGRADLRARTAAAIQDPRESAALLACAAADRDRGPGPALDELRKAVQLSPGDARARVELETALRRAGDLRGVAALIEGEVAQSSDPELRLSALLRVAELREGLGDDAGALGAYREALQLVPGLLPALQGARRLNLRLGDFASARATFRQEAAATRDPERAVECYLEAGKIAEERLADVSAAAQDYRAALEKKPLDPRASRRLEEVLAVSGGPQQLAELYEQRGRAERTPPAAADALVAASRIWMEALHDPNRASQLLAEALRRMPAHPEALERRGDLAFAAAQWETAALAYAARVQLGGDPRKMATLHLRLGQIHADRDPARAVAHLQAALAAVPDMLDALTLVAQLHLRGRNPAGAAEALRRVLDLEKDAARLARAHIDLGRTLEEQGDLPGAAEQYQGALDLDPQSALAADLLASTCERLGDPGRLVRALERRADMTSDSALAAQLRVRVAELWAGPLREPERGIDAYRAALELRPADVNARAALAGIYARNTATYGAAVDEHRALLRADPLRIESYRALHQLWESQGAHDRAMTAASLLVALRAADAVEAAYHAQLQANRPVDPGGALSEGDLESAAHPLEKTALSRLFRSIGDQLSKILPADLARFGVSRSDRLKDGNPQRRLFDRLLAALGGSPEMAEVYLAKSERDVLAVENTEPFSVIIGSDASARWTRREQGFLLGRLAWRVVRRTALLSRIDSGTLATLLGSAVRVADPTFEAVGAVDRDLDRRLSRALSRKARRALEVPAAEVAVLSAFDLAGVLAGARYSADRAGLLLCGDAGVALTLAMREDGGRYESAPAVAHALRTRPDLSELVHFALSEEHFRLRSRLKMSIT